MLPQELKTIVFRKSVVTLQRDSDESLFIEILELLFVEPEVHLDTKIEQQRV
jgi:hypothetical protein